MEYHQEAMLIWLSCNIWCGLEARRKSSGLPHGTLFRSGTEGVIRKGLLEADLVEGIVGLPSALFYNWVFQPLFGLSIKNKTIQKRQSNHY
jgi:type I restriction-modification system DNA methylase subunit